MICEILPHRNHLKRICRPKHPKSAAFTAFARSFPRHDCQATLHHPGDALFDGAGSEYILSAGHWQNRLLSVPCPDKKAQRTCAILACIRCVFDSWKWRPETRELPFWAAVPLLAVAIRLHRRETRQRGNGITFAQVHQVNAPRRPARVRNLFYLQAQDNPIAGNKRNVISFLNHPGRGNRSCAIHVF